VIELIGWGSSFILLLTLMRQVYTQWRTRATAGVSKWLFLGSPRRNRRDRDSPGTAPELSVMTPRV
jgi:hypothetical protein